MRRGNKSVFRLFRDKESKTGLSAGIIIRDVRPTLYREKKLLTVCRCEYDVPWCLSLDGVPVKPHVTVHVVCKPNEAQSKRIDRNRRLKRALARTPTLHD